MLLRILLASLALLSAASAASKPNVLFIFADDQSFETIRAFGYTDVDTPNLDRLVSRGAVFTHAYNMGSFSPAVCVASRTMLNTGRTLWRAKAVYDTADAEREAGRLWAQMMSRAGYATYMTGKWHVKANPEKTFDVTKDVRSGMPKDAPEEYNRPLEGKPDPWNPADPKFGGYWAGGRHWSEVAADNAISFLKDDKRGDKPFFMYIAFNAPHDPRQSPQSFLDRYPLERMKVPENFLPEYPYKDIMGCGPGLRDEKLGPFPRTEYAVKVHRHEYYALITHLDEQIGSILAALKASGQEDNTYIIFTADHGLALGHHGLFGKQNMYDESLRVPFIVCGPQIKAGAKSDAPIYLQDAMATALDLANAPKPEHVEFQSVLPLLKEGSSAKPRDTIYGAYLDLQRAVIHDGWKLIVYPKGKVTRLYHVAEDSKEMHDLASDPEQKHRIKTLTELLIAQQHALGDPLDLSHALAP